MSLLFIALSVSYLIPTAVAVYRNHADAKLVFLANLLLGWTAIGWIAALIWACIGEVEVQPIETRGDRVLPGGRLELEGRAPETPRQNR